MGSKAGKVIVPLLAIGGLAALTGPWGMSLWGAEAGAAATTAGAAGATAGATAATAGTAATATGISATAMETAGLSLAGAEAATTGLTAAQAAGPLGHLAVPGAALDGAGLSMGGVMPAISEPASSGLFSSLLGKTGSGALLTYGEGAGLGVSGAGAAMQASQAGAAAKEQGKALEVQRKQAELQAESSELDSQDQLRHVLASQLVTFGARGQDPTAPTGLRLAGAAEAEAGRDIGSARANMAFDEAGFGLRNAALSRQRRGAATGGLLSFGRDAWSVANGRRLIG